MLCYGFEQEKNELNDLLISSGSDSHGPDHKPIKYRAELSRSLLERVGMMCQPLRRTPQFKAMIRRAK